MTMREEFEAWAELYLPNDESPRKIALAAWQAAYRAGQAEMRERAAKAAENLDAIYLPRIIRALPLEKQP